MSRTPRLVVPALGAAAVVATLAAAATPAQAVTLCVDPPPGQTTLETIRLQTTNSTSITARYQLPFGCYDLPTELRVLVDGVPRDPVAGDVSGSLTVDGLAPATGYVLTFEYRRGEQWVPFGSLEAVTAPDGLPTPTPAPSPTPEPPLRRTFLANSAVLLRTAGTAGTFRLSSSLTAELPTTGVGGVRGSFGGATAPGTLVIGGIVRAKTSVTLSGGPLSGSLSGGRLSVTASTDVSFGRTTVLGVTLNASPRCKTTKPVQLPLEGAFTGSAGRLTGRFSLPPFADCGSLGLFLGATSAASVANVELLPALELPPTPLPVPAS